MIDLAVIEAPWPHGPDHQRVVGGEPVDVLDGELVPDLPRDIDRRNAYLGPSAGLDARHQRIELSQEILGRFRLNRPRPKILQAGLQVFDLVAPSVDRIVEKVRMGVDDARDDRLALEIYLPGALIRHPRDGRAAARGHDLAVPDRDCLRDGEVLVRGEDLSVNRITSANRMTSLGSVSCADDRWKEPRPMRSGIGEQPEIWSLESVHRDASELDL